jgi:hypothetical protein
MQNCENNPMHGSRRVALVIGNGSYVHVPALPNPANDARSIAKSLRDIGFAVPAARPSRSYLRSMIERNCGTISSAP